MSTLLQQRRVAGPSAAPADSLPAPTGLMVRPAQPSDLVPLTFFFDTMLRNDYFLRRGQLADMLRAEYHQVFVAEVDSILVAIAITTRGSHLVNAIVHPAYRGLGIGRALVECSGAQTVNAKLDMSTGDPRGFYGALGFERTGCPSAKGNIELLRRRQPGRGRNDKSGRTAPSERRCARATQIEEDKSSAA